ncbi:hypothetical protein LTR85_006425 [Meristemomyces frigidus]|nr:hypothetical protein LTR85_006425 [Meristemomyces frigidus]
MEDHKQQSCPTASFLGLPLELRQEIYDHVFGSEERWVVYHIHAHVYDLTAPNYFQNKRTAPGSLGVLRTCSQVYEEASNLFYASSKVTACIRPPVATAWSKSSISLGLVKNMRLWQFVRNLELTIQLEPKIDLLAYLQRISGFITVIGFGAQLRKLRIVLQVAEDEALPAYTEKFIDTLAQLQVENWDVSVCIDGDLEEGERQEICGGLKARIVEGTREKVAKRESAAP